VAASPAPADVLFVGRLIAAKGVDVLLEALARVGGVTAAIAGDGPERAELEEVARRLGITDRVRFLGWISARERDELFAGAKAFVMPSLWQEPFGIAGLEALAAGVPVVASAVGGIPSWLRHDEAGLLVPAAAPDALAEALERLLGEEGLHARLRAQGPVVAERFSMARHLELLLPELRGAAA
jgi:glycosyltransferase involved in cell wall biosynthesis